jgi:8-oxo-dGTP pyrophosphatase MutT (NUDIX family)
MGAGVIPFSVHGKQVYFLFQTTFSGRKAGYLVDFGGGIGQGEGHMRAAVREFIEETETMYFADDLRQARCSVGQVSQQIAVVEALFEKTLSLYPDWWCDRLHAKKSWRTYFIEFPYRDVGPLNLEWRQDDVGRFKKRRELTWITAEALLSFYETTPERLWRRVRQLDQATNLIRNIVRIKGPWMPD